jgi:hypothetical protein
MSSILLIGAENSIGGLQGRVRDPGSPSIPMRIYDVLPAFFSYYIIEKGRLRNVNEDRTEGCFLRSEGGIEGFRSPFCPEGMLGANIKKVVLKMKNRNILKPSGYAFSLCVIINFNYHA